MAEHHSKGGRNCAASLTPQQRFDRAKAAAIARWHRAGRQEDPADLLKRAMDCLPNAPGSDWHTKTLRVTLEWLETLQ